MLAGLEDYNTTAIASGIRIFLSTFSINHKLSIKPGYGEVKAGAIGESSHFLPALPAKS
ncbi:MAG TPA: hypothetical protein PLA19_05000 [Candidatus Pacearchaeota archaeon]|nr:hypothetical protein [Candidatus Pacearchaeota archaeon]